MQVEYCINKNFSILFGVKKKKDSYFSTVIYFKNPCVNFAV